MQYSPLVDSRLALPYNAADPQVCVHACTSLEIVPGIPQQGTAQLLFNMVAMQPEVVIACRNCIMWLE